jgi:hypothetical protein
MNRTASKKGAAGKFLALLASLTMIVVGLVGVAFAAPANATVGQEQSECPVGWDFVKKYDGVNANTWAVPAEYQGADFVVVGKSGNETDGFSGPVLKEFGPPAPASISSWRTKVNPAGETSYQAISHATICGKPQQPFPYEKQVTITKTICQDEETTILDASAQGSLIQGTLQPKYTPEEKAKFIADIDAAALLSAQEAFSKAYDPYTEGACDTPDVPVYEASLTCTAWSASVQMPMDREYDSESQLKAVEKVYDVEVYLDGVLIDQGDLDENGAWSDNGSVGPFADGKTHTLVVTLFGEPVATDTSEVCPTVIITDCTATNSCGGGETQTYSAPGGSGEFCSATGETVNVKWDGVSGQGSQDAANEGAAFNKNTALNAKGVPFGTEPGACVAAGAVVTAAALPATVPAPAKKPVVVSAPKPAKVAGGVAGTVGVPQSATVPAAVPAGDGSQAPALPMWALALVVAGALGAAAAGKQIVGARK